MTLKNRNETGGKKLLAVFVGLFAVCGLIGLLPGSSAAPGVLPDMRGSWQGAFVAGGMPVATPIPISMDIDSQGIGNFSGTFAGFSPSPGTLSGSVAANGSVRFQGSSADVGLSNGRALFVDYGGGAAIIDGTVTIVSTNPFIAGVRKIREIRPFVNEGNCPCTPRVGDYIGTWGRGGAGGPIRFTVQAADPAMPTRFTSYLSITIAGQQRALGLIGTANANGDIVAIGHGSSTGRIILTGVLTQQPFLRASFLKGTFQLELNDGTVINERFSATNL